MTRIVLENGAEFSCQPGDTLLRAGLRAGIGLPYECNAGACGTCKVEVIEGAVHELMPDAAGLSERDRRKNRVLACQCVPTTDCRLKVRTDAVYVPPVPPARRPVRLTAIRDITHDIREFCFQGDDPATFVPGQYALLELGGITRAYSLANRPNPAGEWRFQIRRVPGGSATTRLFAADPAQGLDAVLDGPYGLAYLRPTPRAVVCIAGGSGLAPMLSIAKGYANDECFADRPLYFFHGGREGRDLCDPDWMRSETGLGERLHYVPSVSAATESGPGLRQGFIHQVLETELHGRLTEFDFFCAGPPPMLRAVESLLIEQAQLPPERLHFDRFF